MEQGSNSSEVRKVPTGIPELDKQLGGGFEPGGIAVLGPPQSGKRVFCLQFLFQAVSKGGSAVYGAADRSFDEIRNCAKTYGLDLKKFEEEQLMIIDSTHKKIYGTLKTKGVVLIERGSSVEKYVARVREISGRVRPGGVDVVDSLNGLMQNLAEGPRAIVEMAAGFRHELTAKVQSVALHILHTGLPEEKYIQEIMSFQNRVVHMRRIKEPNIFMLKVVDTDHHIDTGWLSLRLTDKGMVYIPPIEVQIDRKISSEHLLKTIELSRKCKPEDERIHPKVAAVIVKGNKIIKEAFRGEIRDGDHAEYTLLERKCIGISLRGSTLITTLEPCTTRKHPRRPCVAHIIRRGIAKVIIGMLDPNPQVRGNGEIQLLENKVDIEHFPAELKKVVWDLNKEYIEQQRKSQI